MEYLSFIQILITAISVSILWFEIAYIRKERTRIEVLTDFDPEKQENKRRLVQALKGNLATHPELEEFQQEVNRKLLSLEDYVTRNVKKHIARHHAEKKEEEKEQLQEMLKQQLQPQEDDRDPDTMDLFQGATAKRIVRKRR